MNKRLVEKKLYSFQELVVELNNKGTIYLSDLLETPVSGNLVTLFVNHSTVIRDVAEVNLMKEGDSFIHGIVDVYDRVQREKTHNSSQNKILNDNIADIVIKSDIVLNVLKLGVMNFIMEEKDKESALYNEYLIELYTDSHIQHHYLNNQFFELFFEGQDETLVKGDELVGEIKNIQVSKVNYDKNIPYEIFGVANVELNNQYINGILLYWRHKARYELQEEHDESNPLFAFYIDEDDDLRFYGAAKFPLNVDLSNEEKAKLSIAIMEKYAELFGKEDVQKIQDELNRNSVFEEAGQKALIELEELGAFSDD